MGRLGSPGKKEQRARDEGAEEPGFLDSPLREESDG